MNKFIETFIQMHPKLTQIITNTCLIWNCDSTTSISYNIIQSPIDPGTCLMCVIVNDFVCPFAFCNSFTSWAFVKIKRIKQLPPHRFVCCLCKKFVQTFVKCNQCRSTICEQCQTYHNHADVTTIENFEYLGFIDFNFPPAEPINLNEIFSYAIQREFYDERMQKGSPVNDPMIHREHNAPWNAKFLSKQLSAAAA